MGMGSIPYADACWINCQPIDFCDDIILDPFCFAYYAFKTTIENCEQVNITGSCDKWK